MTIKQESPITPPHAPITPITPITQIGPLAEELQEARNRINALKESNNDLSYRNKSLAQKASKAKNELTFLRELVPLKFRKNLETIEKMDPKLADLTTPRKFGLKVILYKCAEAIVAGYNPKMLNYKIVLSQFNFACLKNIKGMASYHAMHPDVKAFWKQFYGTRGKAAYNDLRGNGFKDGDEDDEVEDCDEDLVVFCKPATSQKSVVSENSGAIFGPDSRTIGNWIQAEKAGDNTFGLSEKRLDDATRLAKLDKTKFAKMANGNSVLEHGHILDESGCGLDTVTIRVVDGKETIYGLVDYGGLEEHPDFPFNLLPGVAKSKNQVFFICLPLFVVDMEQIFMQLEAALNNHRDLNTRIQNELKDFKDEVKNFWDWTPLAESILDFLDSILSKLLLLRPHIQSTTDDLAKSLRSSDTRLRKKNGETAEMHGNAIAARDRKVARISRLGSFNSTLLSLKNRIDTVSALFAFLEKKPASLEETRSYRIAVHVVLTKFLADGGALLVNESCNLFKSTALALSPRGTKLQIHLLSDSQHFGSHILFSFMVASVPAAISRYIDGLVYDECAKRGIYLAFMSADGATIAHTMYKDRDGNPTTAPEVYRQSSAEFDAEIQTPVNGLPPPKESKKLRKLQCIVENSMKYVNTISKCHFSPGDCWFRVPELPLSCAHMLKKPVKPLKPAMFDSINEQQKYDDAKDTYTLESKSFKALKIAIRIEASKYLLASSVLVFLAALHGHSDMNEVELEGEMGL